MFEDQKNPKKLSPFRGFSIDQRKKEDRDRIKTKGNSKQSKKNSGLRGKKKKIEGSSMEEKKGEDLGGLVSEKKPKKEPPFKVSR